MLISIDRLTRFKHPDIAYPRVFRDIIHKTFLSSRLSDKAIDELPPEEIKKYVKKVWHSSLKQFVNPSEYDDLSHRILTKIPEFCFKITSPYTKELMKTPLYCAELLFTIDELPKNLRIIKYTLLNVKDGASYSDDLIFKVRREKKLLFPLQKLVIVEGITEDILLPAFADYIGKSLSERGIFIFSAGGKTKIPSLYAQFKDELKIPIVVVFDNDANDLSDNLRPYLRSSDKIIVNSKGEFEDLLSLSLIRRTLNNTYYNSEKSTFSELRSDDSMCKNLEEYYRSRNLGEFKKAQFSKLLVSNVKYDTDVSVDIRKLIENMI